MPLSLGDKLGLYEILSPIGTGGIQPLTRTAGVIAGSAHDRRHAIPLALRRCFFFMTRGLHRHESIMRPTTAGQSG